MLTLELGDFPPLSDTNVMITLELHHIETVPQTSVMGTFKIIPVCEIQVSDIYIFYAFRSLYLSKIVAKWNPAGDKRT